MKFEVIGCSGGQVPGHNLSSYLLHSTLLIDAGSTAAVLDLEGQQKIRNILITHVQLDHIMSLATMADNLFGRCKTTIDTWRTSVEKRISNASAFYRKNGTDRSRRDSVRSLPSTSITSKIPGLAVPPVSATRTGWAILPNPR